MPLAFPPPLLLSLSSLSFPASSLCPLSAASAPPFVGWQQTETSPKAWGFKSEASHAFVYQRSDYPVGCYLSPGDGSGVSGMTVLAPVGDVWSGMERQGLMEVLGSYQAECDLTSYWIPWGKWYTDPEVEIKLCPYCYLCVLQRYLQSCTAYTLDLLCILSLFFVFVFLSMWGHGHVVIARWFVSFKWPDGRRAGSI